MQINSISKQLLFSTVRITNQSAGGVSFGTGFLLDADPGLETHIPLLVTNKHVVAGARVLQFEFTRADTAGLPTLGSTHLVTVTDPQTAWVGHPNPAVDVAVMPLAQVVDQAPVALFYRTLPITLFPSPEAADQLDAIEDITFVGYPNGHRDEVHKTPIVRRGITATPVGLPFDGRPVFLIDGSVFGGSSGSPALIFNQGAYPTPDGLSVGTRLLLVGIVAETVVRNQVLPLQVTTTPHTRLAQELNLGVVFNWSAIDESIDELFRLVGQERPATPAIADRSGDGEAPDMEVPEG